MEALPAALMVALRYASPRLRKHAPLRRTVRRLFKNAERREAFVARIDAGDQDTVLEAVQVALAADRPELLRMLLVDEAALEAFHTKGAYSLFFAYYAPACLETFLSDDLGPDDDDHAFWNAQPDLYEAEWVGYGDPTALLLVRVSHGEDPTYLLELMASRSITSAFEILRALGAQWSQAAILDLRIDTREDLLVALEAGLAEALKVHDEPDLWDHVIHLALTN
jgi:hypothetical protein